MAEYVARKAGAMVRNETRNATRMAQYVITSTRGEAFRQTEKRMRSTDRRYGKQSQHSRPPCLTDAYNAQTYSAVSWV